MKMVENGLYPFFWQHGEAPEVLEQYMEKISESGMKGVCIEARPHPDFVGDGWWHDLSLILAKAKELEMKMWILDDSHFPTGFANGKIKECYPQYKKIYLDMRRYDVQGPMNGARINLKMLKGRPWEKPDLSEKVLGVYLAKRNSEFTEAGDPIMPDTLTEITGQMRMSDRLLTLDIPSGAWSIFCVFLTEKRGEDATKDYLNPLVKEATQILIDEVYEPHFHHYGAEFGKTIQGFFSDEPRFGNIKGTEGSIGRPGMVLPWREDLEKELGFEAKYLPLLWTPAKGMERQIRFRYMDVVTRLYEENFTKVLGDWCKEHGVWYLGHTIEDNGAHARLGYGTGHFFRGQKDMDFSGIDVIGGQVVPGMCYHHDAFNTGGSNGEFYHYALAKLGTSAAHLDPRKKGRTMCEAFGAYGWNEGLKMMKWIADHLMVRGVNYIVPHAFNPKVFPDWDCAPHFYAHGNNPQFRYFKTFTDYVNRTMSLFRDGKHPAKVGLFYPAEMEWAGAYMPVEKPARELTVHQISFDIVSRDYLNAATVAEGHYFINGQDMEIMIVPYGEAIPADTAEKLVQLDKAGVQVLFLDKKPKILVGIAKEGVEKTFSKIGTVILLDEIGTALKSHRAVQLDQEQPYLVVGEYEKDGKRIFMFFNENIGETIDAKVSVDVEGKGLRYNAFDGSRHALKQEQDGIRLVLSPYESAIWIFGEEEAVEEKQEYQWTAAALPKEWKISFADSFSYPVCSESVQTKELCCIQTLEGWEDKVGTVVYETTLDLEKETKAARLDLGTVYETAEVFVNGTSAGVRVCAPYQFDLSGLLKQGANELRIEVTNTLGTKVRGGLDHYLPIEPFGVEGPAKLEVAENIICY